MSTRRFVEVGQCPAYPGCGCGTQSGPHACEHESVKFTTAQFMKFPMAIREQYWKETLYGKHPHRASAELQQRVKVDLLRQDCQALLEAGHNVTVRNGKAEATDGQTNWG